MVKQSRCVHCHQIIGDKHRLFIYSRSQQIAHINCVSFPDIERMDQILVESFGEPLVDITFDVAHTNYIESLPVARLNKAWNGSVNDIEYAL